MPAKARRRTPYTKGLKGKGKGPRRQPRSTRPTVLSDSTFAQIAARPTRQIATGTKVAMAAVGLTLAGGVGYLAYKELRDLANAPGKLAPKKDEPVLNKKPKLLAASFKPIISTTKEGSTTKPVVVEVPRTNISRTSGATPPATEFGDWQSTERITRFCNEASRVFKTEKYGRSVAGIPTLPGDMEVRLTDLEKGYHIGGGKKHISILFSPWKRPGQLTFNNAMVGRKARAMFVETMFASRDPETIAMARSMGFGNGYSFFGHREKSYERAIIKPFFGFGDKKARQMGQSSVYLGETQGSVWRSEKKRIRDKKTARYLTGIVDGSVGPTFLDTEQILLLEKIYKRTKAGNKWPSQFRDKIWAMDRYQIGADRRNIFEDFYYQVTGTGNVPGALVGTYPNYIMGVAGAYGGPLEAFYHAITAEETWGEWFVQHLLPLIGDIVQAILTILAIFTAGATLVVAMGLKVLQAAAEVAMKITEVVKKVLSYVSTAVAFIQTGLETIVAKGLGAIKAGIQVIIDKAGSIDVEGSAEWRRTLKLATDVFPGKEVFQAAADMQARTHYSLDRALSRMGVAKSHDGDKLWKLDGITMFYADPTDIAA